MFVPIVYFYRTARQSSVFTGYLSGHSLFIIVPAYRPIGTQPAEELRSGPPLPPGCGPRAPQEPNSVTTIEFLQGARLKALPSSAAHACGVPPQPPKRIYFPFIFMRLFSPRHSPNNSGSLSRANRKPPGLSATTCCFALRPQLRLSEPAGRSLHPLKARI